MNHAPKKYQKPEVKSSTLKTISLYGTQIRRPEAEYLLAIPVSY